jgi:hypothetical protein
VADQYVTNVPTALRPFHAWAIAVEILVATAVIVVAQCVLLRSFDPAVKPAIAGALGSLIAGSVTWLWNGRQPARQLWAYVVTAGAGVALIIAVIRFLLHRTA